MASTKQISIVRTKDLGEHRSKIKAFYRKHHVRFYEESLAGIESEALRGRQSFIVLVTESSNVKGIMPVSYESFLFLKRASTYGPIGKGSFEQFLPSVRKAMGFWGSYLVYHGKDIGVATPSKVAANTYVLDLKGQTEEDIWTKTLNKKSRNLVRKAKKSGLTIRVFKGVEAIAELEAFHKVYKDRMRRFGSPIYPLQYFMKFFNSWNESALISVYHKGSLIAASVLTGYRGKLSNPYAVSSEKALQFAANNFLYWEIIKYGVAEHYAQLDMGPSLAGSTVSRFKESMGGKPVPEEHIIVLNRFAYSLFLLARFLRNGLKKLSI